MKSAAVAMASSFDDTENVAQVHELARQAALQIADANPEMGASGDVNREDRTVGDVVSAIAR